MTSPSQPSGFAAYFAAQASTASSGSLIHGLTSPPRTDSPSDSKGESAKGSVSESPATGIHGTTTPAPTPPLSNAALQSKSVDISAYAKRAWRLIHDPELHPKSSVGRSKPKEIRQSGQGVPSVSDPRKIELNYGANSSKGKKKYSNALQKLQFQFDENSVGPPPPAQIVIWGFSQLVTREQVQLHFRPFGDIQELDFKVDPASGASLGVCRIKFKVDKKDMMSGHAAATKAVQDGSKIKLGGAFVHVELDKDGLKTVRRVGEYMKKRLAEQAAAKEKTVIPKPIPTGPAADRREKPRSPTVTAEVPPPPPKPDSSKLNDLRRQSESRTPLPDSSRTRQSSPRSHDRRKSTVEATHRGRSRSRGHDDRNRHRSPSPSYSPDWRRDSRRYRSPSRDRDRYHRRRSPSYDRRRSSSPRHRKAPDDRPSAKEIDEYRPSYSSRFRPGVDDFSPSRRNGTRSRDLTPDASPSRRRKSPDRGEERGRSRRRSPLSRTRTPSDSRSPDERRRTAHEKDRRRDSDSHSRAVSPSDVPRLPSFISHKIGGRPYIFISDRDLPVRQFSARDLGLCFKKFHPSVYDDDHGFYIAFFNYQAARDCFAAHGDGKSYIDGYKLRMKLIDDKEAIKLSKGVPSRKAPPPKKSLEEEVTDAIVTELKEVFIKDIRSRVVNPLILDFLDPSHHKGVQQKSEPTPTPVKISQPQAKPPVVKVEAAADVPVSKVLKTNRMPLLPRFRKKGTDPVKGEESVRDRIPSKADVRPMHHQFNHYSDSEGEDETPRREATAVSDEEDESSRPSRETTSVSTPEPTKVKPVGKTLVRTKDIATVSEEANDHDLVKDILDMTTDNEIVVTPSKRKKIIDFTSSEDEDEEIPLKKTRVDSETPEAADAMEIDVIAPPKLSKAAIIKAAKAKAAAVRRAKKVEIKEKHVDDTIAVEAEPPKEIKPQIVGPPKVPEVNLEEIEDDEDILLDLDGVQSLVRDKEDYRSLLQALTSEDTEPIYDIWTWSWKKKTIKALNFDGAKGPIKKLEPPTYNRINPTGSARTEGYIKIPEAEKSLYLPQRNKAIVPIGSETARKTSRMNRVNNRRLAADMELQKKTLSTESDILRFNQLKARKKQLKFARSPIHDWGLFAMEDIEAHEMVIEYVGEIVRFQVAELREKQYERVGIGSSYLFRVDDENIIDATKTGNIARFINHCCTPNCSAKIIQVQGEKKIVIYADRFIAAGEEITYDYKFPREDVKIPCFCGSTHCKGTLN